MLASSKTLGLFLRSGLAQSKAQNAAMGKDKKKGNKGKGKASSGADAGTPPTAEAAVQHAAKHKLLGGRKGKAVTYRSRWIRCRWRRGAPRTARWRS